MTELNRTSSKLVLSLLVLAATEVAGCGGSGGTDGGSGSATSGNSGGSSSGNNTSSGGSTTFSLNTHSLTFAAANPLAATPASQNVVGTVTGTLPGGGTLYIVVKTTGPAVSNVSDFVISGSSGSGAVTPAQPISLGAGTFSGTVTVHACLNDQTCATGELAGSPQMINVTYTVGTNVPADSVMPHVVTSGTAGEVVIRGHALSGVSAVSFGSTAATAVTVLSDTEVHASYPATLSPGTLSVTLNGGSIASPGSIAAVARQPYSGQMLAYPQAPQGILGALYDAERSALFVAASFAQSANNRLWHYTYSGGTWSAASETPIPGLQGIQFSNDGSRLIALTGYSLYMLDPASGGFPPSSTVPGPFPQSGSVGSKYLYTFALANDGNGIVTVAGVGTTGPMSPYLYAPTAPGSFIALPTGLLLNTSYIGGTPMLASSADGSLLLAAQTGVSPPQPVLQYNPATTLVSATSVSINQVPGEPPVMDAGAAKRVVYDGRVNSVYDSNYRLLGNIPGVVRVLSINRQGTRVYALTQDSTLHTYDLTATTVNGNYPEIGSGSAQTVPASNSSIILRLEITPDGGTLFLAGDTGVAVIPAPN